MAQMISIIIPVYNVEKYIARCIDSILRQTYRRYELILIDDGSTDDSGRICDSYAEKDERVCVIHKVNEGAGTARNVGIALAKGEYLTFIDSDDYVSDQYLEQMYNVAEREKCQIVQCDFAGGCKNDYGFPMPKRLKQEVLDNHTVFYTRKAKIIIWAKLYRRELFEGIYYPKLSIHDDEFITYKLLFRAEKIVLINAKNYYYYQSDNSIMRTTKNYLPDNFIKAYEERVDFFTSCHEDELAKVSYKEKCIRLLLFYRKCHANPHNTNNQSKILQQFEEDYPKAIKAKMNFLERGFLVVFHVFLCLTQKRWR